MKDMVEKFQCPGCVVGSNAECGKFKIIGTPQAGETCKGWHPGTFIAGRGAIALGLPKGFNRLGTLLFVKRAAADENAVSSIIRLFSRSEYEAMLHQPSDEPGLLSSKLNVPIWAMEGTGEDEGYLFVRMFAPRIGWHWIDVIKGGTIDMVPNAINVAEFIDKID